MSDERFKVLATLSYSVFGDGDKRVVGVSPDRVRSTGKVLEYVGCHIVDTRRSGSEVASRTIGQTKVGCRGREVTRIASSDPWD